MTREQYMELHGELGSKLGVVSPAMYTRYEHYNAYKLLRKELPHMEAVERVAEEQRCSSVTVWNSVSFFLKSPEVDL